MGTTLIGASFETGFLRESGVAGWQCAPHGRPCIGCSDTGYAITAVETRDHPSGGKRGIKLDRRRGDDPMLGGVRYGERAQFQFQGRAEENDGGGFLAVRLVMTILPGDPPGGWNVKGWQWHAKANGSPSLSFYREGNTLVLSANKWGSSGIISYNHRLFTWPVDAGVQHCYDIHLNASNSDSVGWIEAFRDGVRTGQRINIRTTPPRHVGCYSIVSEYAQSGSAPGALICNQFGLRSGDPFPPVTGGELPPPLPPPDTEGPSVEFVIPAMESSHVGRIPVKLTVRDISGVSSVQAGINVPNTAATLTRSGEDTYEGVVTLPATLPYAENNRYWLWATAIDTRGNKREQAIPVRLPGSPVTISGSDYSYAMRRLSQARGRFASIDSDAARQGIVALDDGVAHLKP